MSDDGGVYENIEEVSDSPEALRDHGLDPARDNENDEPVEREDAKGEREWIDFAGADVKGDESIGECRQNKRIKEETYAVEECEEKGLNGECVVNGE